MDFFNTAYWSNKNFYTEWRSIYPPLNFFFLDSLCAYFDINLNEYSSSFELRDDGAGLISFFLLSNVFLIFFVSLHFSLTKKLNKKSIFLFFALILLISPAYLFALERGNLIVYAIPLLYFLIALKSIFSRILILSVLVNIKPYLFLLSVVFLVKKQYYYFVMYLFCSAFIYLFFGLLTNDNAIYFLENLFLYVGGSSLYSGKEVLSFPGTVLVFTYLLDGGFLEGFISLVPSAISPLIKIIVYSLWLLLLFFVFYRARSLSDFSILFFLTVLITNLGVFVGGYTLMFYSVFLVFMLFKENCSKFIVFLLVLINLSIFDLFYFYSTSPVNQFSYLSGDLVDVEWFLSVGSILRAVLNFLVLFYCVVYLWRLSCVR
jgi:hypothetical protein